MSQERCEEKCEGKSSLSKEDARSLPKCSYHTQQYLKRTNRSVRQTADDRQSIEINS